MASQQQPQETEPFAAEASAALVAAAEAALASCAQRIVVVEHGGASYVVKRLSARPRSAAQSLLLRWLAQRVIGRRLPLGMLRLSPSGLRADYEASRLDALARAGIRVPRVLHRDPDYLLLEHCGSSIALLLHQWDTATWRDQLPRLAGQLGAFHTAGQWHGAAQIKNLTRRGSLDYRIDFEESFGEQIPLVAAQALDLALFLNSVCLRSHINEAEARWLLPRLLDAYFASHPDPQVAAMLARALPWATALVRPAAAIMRWQAWGRRRRGVARLLIVCEVLSGYLAKGWPDLQPLRLAPGPGTRLH